MESEQGQRKYPGYRDTEKRRKYQQEYQKKYRVLHAVEIAAEKKKWHQAHPKSKEYTRKYRTEHREYFSQRNKEWIKQHPREAKSRWLKKVYGISIDDYEQLLERQNGRCAACRKLPGRRALCVDHDHNSSETGKIRIRGLLCDFCNQALGYVYDNPDILRSLANYLETKP
jgi:hypothetical protein